MPPVVLPPARALPEDLLPALARMSPSELVRRRDVARGLVEDDGILVGPDLSGLHRHLVVDPVPLVVPARDWADLERGLAQRAELLDLVLADLYGERTLVSRGLLPPELVVGHPGFVPQADGVSTRHGLFLTAADLGRDEHGSWCVVADRAHSPVGTGYAMAVRRVTARALASLHRETDLRRLRDFFDTMRSGLQEMATGTSELPRVVMLTSPESDDSTFDTLFTATLLGFPVVRAEDLSMRNGRVWLRTTERPQPVDVVVRRVGAQGADPLDLAAGAGTGVPGLVEATRRGLVAVVNPLGARVLDDPALGAFLPAIASALLGEELRLPSARTWWCGDPAGLRYVRDHLEALVLAPISPSPDNPRVFAGEVRAAQREQLRARIESKPWAWCAQEVLPVWTAPVVTDSGLSPRAGLLRTFTLADARGTSVMPGGLVRVSNRAEDARAPSLRDAVVKDVWVLAAPASGHTEAALGPAVGRSGDGAAARPPAPAGATGTAYPPASADAHTDLGATHPLPTAPVPVSPRAAEDLYWFGRYAERAESTARLVLVADDLVEDHQRRPATPGFEAMRTLIDVVDALTAVQRYRATPGDRADLAATLPTDPAAHLRALVFDETRPGTVHYSAHRAARAAGQVRDVLSFDTWLVLSRLDRSLGEPPSGENLQSVLAMVIESLLALAGIGAESLVRDASWAFFDAGRRVERGHETVRILRQALTTERAPRVERLVLDAVLRARESLISYRRRMADISRSNRSDEVALDLLLCDPTNPRSVRFQIERLREDLTHAPSAPVHTAVSAAAQALGATDVVALAADRAALAAYLDDVEADLHRVSTALDATSFRRQARQQPIEQPR